MRETPVWCAKCHLRVAPYDLRTVYRITTYHQHRWVFKQLCRSSKTERCSGADVDGQDRLTPAVLDDAANEKSHR